MGLDMYLQADIYIGGRFEHNHVKGECAFSIGQDENLEKYNLALNEINSITIDIGYWRKANAIHNWFVKNVQDDIDECQRTWVDREKLKELKNLCTQVVNNPDLATGLLPTGAGFFFGSTDYDEWYQQDIKETIEIIDKALKLPNEYSIYYQASW